MIYNVVRLSFDLKSKREGERERRKKKKEKRSERSRGSITWLDISVARGLDLYS